MDKKFDWRMILPGNGLTEEEEALCTYLVYHLKDVCDTDNVMSGSNVRNTEVLELRFNKPEGSEKVNFSAFLILDDNKILKHENRCITGTIEQMKNDYYVESQIDRLCTDSKIPNYKVVDYFKKTRTGYSRSSKYGYKDDSTIELLTDFPVKSYKK